MKKYLLILLLCILPQPFPALFCGAAAPKTPAPGGMGIPGFSKEEEEYMLAMLDEFSEEELEELARVGEQTIKNLEQKGISIEQALTDPSVWEDPDLFDNIDFGNLIDTDSTSSAGPAKPEKPLEPIIEEEDGQTGPTKPQKEVVLSVSDKEKLQIIKNNLADIAEKIVSLQQKAETKRSLRELIKPFELALADVLYFVLTIKDEQLLQYFVDKKFAPLHQLITELHEILEIYEPQVYVTEFSLEGEDPYTILGVSPSAPFEKIYKRYQQLSKEENPLAIKSALQEQNLSDADLTAAFQAAQERWDSVVWAFEALQAKEKSKEALELILNALQSALYEHDFLGKTKEFLKAFDPDALKIKEEQEKKEKKAREDQERLARQRAPWVPGIFEPTRKPASYDAPFYTGATFPQSKSASSKDSGTDKGGSGSDAAGSAGDKKGGGGKKPGAKKPGGDKKDGKEDKKDDKKSDDKKDKKDEKKKDDKKPGLDRDVLRIEDKLEALQETLGKNEKTLESFKEYLGAAFTDADKAKAVEINTLLGNITQQTEALDKAINKDLDKLKDDKKKDNKAKKKTYTEGVTKAYEKFAKDEKVKKGLKTVQEFTTAEGGVLVNNEPFAADATKRFLVTGVPTRGFAVTDELKRINNPVIVTDDQVGLPTIDYIKNTHDAVIKFEKLMKEKFPQSKPVATTPLPKR